MPRRQFMHLSQVELRSIVVSYFGGGETKEAIAERIGIDVSSVTYQLRKYEKAKLESSSIYAQVKRSFHPFCEHPSLKCSLCGRHKDNLQHDTRQTVHTLEERLLRANKRLQRAGLPME